MSGEYTPRLPEDIELATDILSCDPVTEAMWLGEIRHELVEDLRADGISADEALAKRALLNLCTQRYSQVAFEVATLIDSDELAKLGVTVGGVRAVAMLDHFRRASELADALDKDIDALQGELSTFTGLGILIEDRGDSEEADSNTSYCITPIGKAIMPMIANYLLNKELDGIDRKRNK